MQGLLPKTSCLCWKSLYLGRCLGEEQAEGLGQLEEELGLSIRALGSHISLHWFWWISLIFGGYLGYLAIGPMHMLVLSSFASVLKAVSYLYNASGLFKSFLCLYDA